MQSHIKLNHQRFNNCKRNIANKSQPGDKKSLLVKIEWKIDFCHVTGAAAELHSLKSNVASTTEAPMWMPAMHVGNIWWPIIDVDNKSVSIFGIQLFYAHVVAT